MDHPYFGQRQARKEARAQKIAEVGHAVRAQAHGWDLRDRLSGDSSGRPSTLPETIRKAIAAVRETLDSTGEFPIPPTIEYKNIHSVRTSGGTEKTPLIGDGILMLHARCLTKTGVRDSFEVPVMVQGGEILQPSVMLHEGQVKVLAPSSVRELVARGTFASLPPARGLFSGPMTHDEAREWSQVEKEQRMQQRINPGMFSVSASRDLLRAAVQGDREFEAVQAQLGEQPARGALRFEASPGTRIGDRIVTVVSWDPETVESMGDNNLQHSIRSFVLELGSKKEWRDWGTVADVQIDEFDRDGKATVSFKSSEISAPQLAPADFEGRKAETVEAAYCEKCKVNHRSTTKCPYAGAGKGKTPAAPKAPLPTVGQTAMASKPKSSPEEAPEEHIEWTMAHMGNVADDFVDPRVTPSTPTFQHAYDAAFQMKDSLTKALGSLKSKIDGMPDSNEKKRALANGSVLMRVHKMMDNIVQNADAQSQGTGKALLLAPNMPFKEDVEKLVAKVRPALNEIAQLTRGQKVLFANKQAAIGPSQNETHIQPAERDKTEQYHVGDSVKLQKGQLVRNRGGGTDTIPQGATGLVIGDMFGDGLNLKVRFEEHSPEVLVIPASHLRSAGKTAGVTVEKVVGEIESLRRCGYSPIDAILTAKQRYGALGETALKAAKAKGLLDW